MIFRVLENLRQKKIQRKAIKKIDSRSLVREWEQINQLVKLGKPSNLKEAVIRADKVLDLVLKGKADGGTLGERLKNARTLFSDKEVYQSLWDAHKIRNALVHDIDFEMPYFVAKKTIAKFKRGLKELGVKL